MLSIQSLGGDQGIPCELYPDDELRAHLEKTVLGPLNIQARAFIPPPAVTSLRVVGGAGGTRGGSASLDPRKVEEVANAQGSPLALAGFTLQSMKSQYGIPEGYLVLPKNTSSSSTEGEKKKEDEEGQSSKEEPVVIVVDAACGEAVLRGSEIFAPGILASSGNYAAGMNNVVVVACINPKKSPLKGSFVTRDTLTSSSSFIVVSQSARVEMDRAEVVCGGAKGVALRILDAVHPPQSLLTDSLKGIVPSSERELREVATEREEVPSNSSSSTSSPYQAFLQNFSSMVPARLLFDIIPPPSSQQQQQEEPFRVLDMCAAPGGKSSQLLSLLGNYIFASGEEDSRRGGKFELCCCERSASRANKLRQLLTNHHGPDLVQETVRLFTCDSNKILQELQKGNTGKGGGDNNKTGGGDQKQKGTHNKKKAERIAKRNRESGKTSNSMGQSTAPETDAVPLKQVDEKKEEKCVDDLKSPVDPPTTAVINPEYFDRILLDPPCTGLGLRPRLSPHDEFTLKAVQESADYQRKLLDSGLRVLKLGGLLSYSTCTISLEENEATVAWALQHYGTDTLEILRFPSCGSDDGADKTGCFSMFPPLVEMAGAYPSWIHVNGLPKEEEEKGKVEGPLAMMRFGPTVTTGSSGGERKKLDSVGFFVVCFRKLKSIQQ